MRIFLYVANPDWADLVFNNAVSGAAVAEVGECLGEVVDGGNSKLVGDSPEDGVFGGFVESGVAAAAI